MKYGRMKWEHFNNSSVNIGDNIQTFVVDYFYKKMGIDENEIVDINNELEIQEYDGDEYVVLPMAGYFSLFYNYKQLPTSEKIIPVFISFEMSNCEECDDIITYLKKHEPIGCRDEATANLLKSKGVDAFLSGCMTIALPKRNKQVSENANTVFLVDVPMSLIKYIPDYLKKDSITVNHCFKSENNNNESIEEYSKNVYEKYRKEAKLVVTSRLHALIPCIAMGIPVIFANENFDDRFSWIDKLVPLYNYKTFDKINWNPEPVECEKIKDIIYNIFKDKVEKAASKARMLELNYFWTNRKRYKYNEVLLDKIEELKSVYDKDDCFSYAIWGAGWHSRLAYRMMKKEFPNAELKLLVDKFVDKGFVDINVTRPKDFNSVKVDHWIITTNPGKNEAIEAIKSIDGKYTIFLSQAYLLPEKNF